MLLQKEESNVAFYTIVAYDIRQGIRIPGDIDGEHGKRSEQDHLENCVNERICIAQYSLSSPARSVHIIIYEQTLNLIWLMVKGMIGLLLRCPWPNPSKSAPREDRLCSAEMPGLGQVKGENTFIDLQAPTSRIIRFTRRYHQKRSNQSVHIRTLKHICFLPSRIRKI